MADLQSKVVDRLLRYAQVYTTSDESSDTCPSTARQLDLGRMLVEELEEMGLNAVLDGDGYVYASLPGNAEGQPVIGLIAHMDTAPDMSGEGVRPQMVERYDGGDIALGGRGDVVLSPRDFPELLSKRGKTLITTDGTTLLGSDDKSGIAEIMTAVEYMVEHPEFLHGKVAIAFTPDEEIGRGADRFRVKDFGADFAYTIDGGGIGELEYENFNAAGAVVTIHGRNVHPGSAKHKMINALGMAYEIYAMLPVFERPEFTEGREGFIHLNDLHGSVDRAEMTLIIRDHDREKFERKKTLLREACRFVSDKHGAPVDLEMKDSYYNMREKVEEDMRPVERALEALRTLGIEPKVTPIRGGTDGARLSYMGLVCPNLFTGGYNFHGRFEFAVAEEMAAAVETIIEIVRAR